MPQRRAPELRPVMRPSYGACSACFCRRNTGRRTVDWRRAGFAAFAARFAAKPLRRDGATFLSPPKGIIIYGLLSMAYYLNINPMLSYDLLSKLYYAST